MRRGTGRGGSHTTKKLTGGEKGERDESGTKSKQGVYTTGENLVFWSREKRPKIVRTENVPSLYHHRKTKPSKGGPEKRNQAQVKNWSEEKKTSADPEKKGGEQWGKDNNGQARERDEEKKKAKSVLAHSLSDKRE